MGERLTQRWLGYSIHRTLAWRITVFSQTNGSWSVTVIAGQVVPIRTPVEQKKTKKTPSTTRHLPAPPALGSSLIRLSGACLMLLSVDLLMLFFLFSAACNWAASPP